MRLGLSTFSATSARRAGPALLVLLGALAQGLLYLFLLPPWQHYDEPAHFEYAWLIANWGRLPAREEVDASMRREVAASMLEHRFYGGLPRPNLLAHGSEIWIGVSELPHPPAYYLLVSAPLHLTRHLDVTSQLYAARGLSLALFLCVTLVAIGIVRDLTTPDHPLRWLAPLSMVLVPPFADVMTSVNNDVGSVCIFSLFLWGAVRIIRFGVTGRRLAWVAAAALLSVITKTTAAVALGLLPLVILLALWSRERWRPRSLALLFCAGTVTGIASVLAWGDAAAWYRWDPFPFQESPTRVADPAAPVGSHATVVEALSNEPNRRLLNPVLERTLPRLAGQTVTVGGWIWAERPALVYAPGLAWSVRGSDTLEVTLIPVRVTTTPTFVANRVAVPLDVERLYYTLFARSATPGEPPFELYLDGAVLVPGTFPATPAPVFDDASAHTGTWAGRPFTNLVRNASAEEAWPRVRPSVELAMARYTRRSASQMLAALWDVERTAGFLIDVVAPALWFSFFGVFAWAHVRLQGALWPHFFGILGIAAVAGCVKWYASGRPGRFVRPALAFLGLAAFLVWGSALLSPLAYFSVARVRLPVARYVFPAIVPTMLVLAGGWWALWPRPYRPWGALALVLVMLALNMVSIVTIRSYYAPLPQP